MAMLVSVKPASVYSVLKGTLVTELQQQPSLKQLLLFFICSFNRV